MPLFVVPDILVDYRSDTCLHGCMLDSRSGSSSPDSTTETTSSDLDSQDIADIPDKNINIGPTCFAHGYVCGHNVVVRDLTSMPKRHRGMRHLGVTINPKTNPIKAGLRDCNQ